MNSKFHKTYLLNWKNDYNSLGEKITIATMKTGYRYFYTMEYRRCGNLKNKTIADHA